MFIGFISRSSSFFDGCALVFLKFLGVDGWGPGGWFPLVLMTILAFCLGCSFA